MRVVFRCDPVLQPYLPPPVPARSALPDWLRQMPSRAMSPTHGGEVRTVKQCPPVIDAMSYGFVIPLPCDITVRGGTLRWQWDVPLPSIHAHPRAPLSFHVPEQVAGSPLHRPGRTIVKFNSFWTVELEPGWSLFATHPANRDDLPFRTLTGLVDADRFSDVGILFPALWTDPGFEGVLARGTPMVQCFAVPRAEPALCVETFSPERASRYQAVAEALLSTPGVYRRRYRARRGRSAGKVPPQGLQVEHD